MQLRESLQVRRPDGRDVAKELERAISDLKIE